MMIEKEPRKESINEQLQQEILRMVDADQKAREGLEGNPEIDKQNSARMTEIIQEFGWPGKSLVGDEAARGAWLLMQHADHDVVIQKKALELLREAVVRGEAEKRNEAYLTDRVRVNSGEPQIFGTQFYKDDGGFFGPRPIEDMEHLDERRKEFGLNMFSEYEHEMRKLQNEFEEKTADKKSLPRETEIPKEEE